MRKLLVPLMLLALPLAACSPSERSAAPNPSASATDQNAQLRAYAKCMRANGVDMPDPNADGVLSMPGIKADSPEMKNVEAAAEKCRDLAPAMDEPRKISAEDLAKARELSKCMRENGLPDFPDPDPETGAVSLSGTTVDMKKMEAAGDKCGGMVPMMGVG
ncbi:hypothetical protein JIG36_35065 [Actinoplanes sp. LDG1-06]|uniref:Secreted protein n=1 Tax=Paractinoplanes ovalisporus TaxID=2810368 RepID=A0ABS2ANF1_9ACTN|nr:hypothetical protein [Actinoplanes ovalisporus]MBM2620734.1 hypothetical protein [Actinoplanes ovalisporus]